MKDKIKKPKVLLSYIIGSDFYHNQVLAFTRQLISDGIEVVNDEKSMPPGSSCIDHIKKCVTDPSVTILVLLDPIYAKKADERASFIGLEFENLFISSEIYKEVAQNRIIPVVMKRYEDGSIPIPYYLQERLYLDLSVPAEYDRAYKRLVKSLFREEHRMPFEMKFEDVSNGNELIAFLKTYANQMKNTISESEKAYVYHYTTIKAVKGILKSKQWYLNSPSNMNDGLELRYLKKMNVKNLFFSSFLTEDKESIAMWSMYSQPWEEGVLIRIPIEMIKKWIKNKPLIYSADSKMRQKIEIIKNANAVLHFVAYTNKDSISDNEQKTLQVGKETNTKFSDTFEYEELAGYIKDTAWAYEKEVRLRVKVSDNQTYNAVMIDIPQDILNSFEFVTGPRFEENILMSLRKIDPDFDDKRITPSLFTGRLNWVYCDSCSKNRQERS